jgi:threonine/homoserine/homoserine lactone efflux protein
MIALTTYGGDEDIRRALAAGVQAYLTKDVLHDELLKAIRAVHAGQTYLPAAVAAALAARATPVRPARAIRDGLVIGVTNPKTIVFFVVALPEFTARGAGHLPLPAQMLIIGALFPAIALVLDAAWAAAAGTARQWFTASPRRLALIGGTGGLVMIGLGVSLAATGRKD